MDRFPQPPDPPEEGICPRCKTWITREELLQDGCIECDDLLIDDMRKLWAGRPKDKPGRYTRYFFLLGGRTFRHYVRLQPSRYVPIDWRGFL